MLDEALWFDLFKSVRALQGVERDDHVVAKSLELLGRRCCLVRLIRLDASLLSLREVDKVGILVLEETLSLTDGLALPERLQQQGVV